MRTAESNSQSEQQSSVSVITLKRLLGYLSTTTENWSFEKIAEICGIDFYDTTRVSTASWSDKNESPFLSGSVFKGGVLAAPIDTIGEQYREKPLMPNCFVVINEKFPLSVGQFAKLVDIPKAQLNEKLDYGDRHISVVYKRVRSLKIKAEISEDRNRIVSITFTNQDWQN
jgi:NADH:ubiquinone oxidoreductase subunit C